jgi:hypothetical protein
VATPLHAGMLVDAINAGLAEADARCQLVPMD